ncbi:LuxR C-terminal-related transcriptional regulator [Vibrio sp. FNV 38]|nr:LuxR C-terminal-related transcriptional regulator [Vibrio sp. FNV 38]
MNVDNKVTFDNLVLPQVNALSSCYAVDFDATFRQLAQQGLEWFNLDRLTLFPNSMIMLNDGKSISVSRKHIPELDKKRYVVGNYLDYLKLLRQKKQYQVFTAHELEHSKISTLHELYLEGGRWHGIVPLDLFGQVWGALAFSRFNNDLPSLTETEFKQLKTLCDIWLVYWQHSTVTRSLNKGNENNVDESEKLLKLSKKQCTVLSLLAQGYTAKQCAEKLFLSPRTIESHKYRMLDALEFDNHTDLVQFALRNGLGIEAS